MPELKTKHVAATPIKADELPAEVLKAAEGKDIDKWYYATVETPDREKDIVRVDGVETKSYTQSGGPIRVLVAHNRKVDEKGRLPIAGKVVECVRTVHKSTGLPALAAGVKFLKTELGRDTKLQADDDVLDVSIGFEPLEFVPIKGGGNDYKRSAIAELSVCITGMNQYAGAVKSWEKEVTQDEVLHRLACIEKFLSGSVGGFEWSEVVDGKTAKHHNLFGHIDILAAGINASFDKISKRLDDIESAVVAKSQEPEPTGDNDPAQTSEAEQALKAIQESLSRIKFGPACPR